MLRSKHVTIMHRMEHHMFQTILEQISFKSSLATNHSHNCFRKNQTLPSKLIYPLRNDGWKRKKILFKMVPFKGDNLNFVGGHGLWTRHVRLNFRGATRAKGMGPVALASPVRRISNTGIGKMEGFSGWWLNQPTWKIWVKLGIISPNRSENKKYVKTPPSFWCL